MDLVVVMVETGDIIATKRRLQRKRILIPRRS